LTHGSVVVECWRRLMDTEVEAERQRETRQLRADLDRLRSVLHSALDTDADRHIIIATATELREKADGLKRLESPGWIE
jgi:hypothetical protein